MTTRKLAGYFVSGIPVTLILIAVLAVHGFWKGLAVLAIAGALATGIIVGLNMIADN